MFDQQGGENNSHAEQFAISEGRTTEQDEENKPGLARFMPPDSQKDNHQQEEKEVEEEEVLEEEDEEGLP